LSAVDAAGFAVAWAPFCLWARTSSEVTRPAGPVAVTLWMSTPMSRASLRVAGVASTAPPAPLDCAAAVTAAAGAFGRDAGTSGAPAGAVAFPGSPSRSITMSTLPTGQRSPSANMRLATRPGRGAGISTVALSVMTSTIG
jgi:hypothetical protein